LVNYRSTLQEFRNYFGFVSAVSFEELNIFEKDCVKTYGCISTLLVTFRGYCMTFYISYTYIGLIFLYNCSFGTGHGVYVRDDVKTRTS